MSVATPYSLPEWAAHAKTLDPDKVYSALKGACHGRFFDKLSKEGFPREEIETIIFFFAKRLRDLGYRFPDTPLYDIKEIFRMQSLTEAADIYKEAEALPSMPVEPDDIDRQVMRDKIASAYPM